MIEIDEDRFRLAMPIGDAISFALGWSDLGYREVSDEMRRVVGVLAIDMLEYNEQWRAAGIARRSLVERWPDCFRW
jgi:hypothetical protein